MQKKIILGLILMMMALVILAGCYHKEVQQENSNYIFADRFVVVEKVISNNRATYLCYDKDTKVMYYILSSGNSLGISVYYNMNGEIGIWPQDYAAEPEYNP